MFHNWQLQEAKNRLSEVIDHALEEGPQTVTRHGTPTAVILSFADYQKLSKPKTGIVEFFRKSPLVGLDLTVNREKDYPRRVQL